MKPRGQALTEYLVATTAIVFALLAPWPDGSSGAQKIADALARMHRAYAYLLSIG
jgi:hypothetical protein